MNRTFVNDLIQFYQGLVPPVEFLNGIYFHSGIKSHEVKWFSRINDIVLNQYSKMS